MRIISVKDARANFSELIGSVYYTNNPVVVEKKGKPFVVMMNPDEYEQYKRLAKNKFFKVVEEIQAKNADQDPGEVYKDVTKIVEEVRQQMYERDQKKTLKSRR